MKKISRNYTLNKASKTIKQLQFYRPHKVREYLSKNRHYLMDIYEEVVDKDIVIEFMSERHGACVQYYAEGDKELEVYGQ